MLDAHGLLGLIEEVLALRDRMVTAEIARADDIEAAHAYHRDSAANLIHYVELRQHDIRGLQTRLGLLGLSSLGRAEPSVLATLEAVLTALAGLRGDPAPALTAKVGLVDGHRLLDRNAEGLLGVAPRQRSTRIMVTLPSEAADDQTMISNMSARGMDIARINCAHDDRSVWQRMIVLLQRDANNDGRPCRIAMDLGGPKLRTGPLMPGPRVIRVKPKRDSLGRCVTPARICISTSVETSTTVDAEGLIVHVPVADPAWVRRRRRGDIISLIDSRGSHRQWTVVQLDAGSVTAVAQDTAYVTTGLVLDCKTGDTGDEVVVGELPEIKQSHRVQLGDRVILTLSMDPIAPTPVGVDHFIGCSLPAAFDAARVGERVWFDDGKIGGTVESVTAEAIAVIVTDVRPGGAKLAGGKGINFPDTDLRLDALTAQDLDDLPFVARHSDIVELSFVRRPEDIETLQRELVHLHASEIGIVLKIENVAAFENLPELLLTAMRSPIVGVMIARGDLAVEVGFERLAEVQEEIMWACEAAHVPVIWATQVLDTLARTGQPSRAEVTDAAMSERAECVMLNKGPYITEAISTLDSILTRMQTHQDKKRSMLRQLSAWNPSPTR